MNDRHAVVQCCDRLRETGSEGDTATLAARLRELADRLESVATDDPAVDDMREAASILAARVDEIEQLTAEAPSDAEAAIHSAFGQQAVALSQRVCRWCLRAGDGTPDALWAARARSLAAEPAETADVLERALDTVEQLDVDESRLSASRRAMAAVIERDSAADDRADRIDELARDL
ncbi:MULTISPECIES: hypothetical protein [Halomicrobium]|uniref:Uncharacterized protein n=2 Tax=Halomicrobium mukohataei TaxID=57705 RepID=C7NZX6_HALMD|nr:MULTISPECIES: hypothetical protein [Halomicrobium]ACV46884.1 hypothetical protein Hmuk_0753 [Halomicrobium mukohataei DSM 12286]QCD65385.1 hypothetical protein E5139_06945 [Halomicrobium mukohataei]QFR20191.1 hypothetical protein GBQ70_06940 [Halomicrobium sp. ZPS1]